MKILTRQRYKLEIRNAKNNSVRALPWRENLVLDSGLTYLANQSTNARCANCFSTASVGSSNAANSVASGAVTFTQSGTSLLASGSFFTSAMTGALLKFGTGTGGSEVYLTFVDATHATASVSQTISTPTVGTVYFVAQTKLTAWLYNADSLNSTGNGTTKTISGGVATITLQRTFVFNQKVSPYTINEIGWGNTGGSNPNVNGRAVLGAPQSIGTDDYVLLTIQIVYTILPLNPTATSNADQVFNQYKGTATTAPTVAIEMWPTGFIDSNGNTDAVNGTIDQFGNITGILLTNSSFVQNSQISTSAPANSTGYGLSSGGFAQVAGQLPGVSQATFSGTPNTNGEKLMGFGIKNAAGNLQISVAANYSVLANALNLPIGNFQINFTFQVVWARQLSN